MNNPGKQHYFSWESKTIEIKNLYSIKHQNNPIGLLLWLE